MNIGERLIRIILAMMLFGIGIIFGVTLERAEHNKVEVQLMQEPSYQQGFYDGFNGTILYLDESDQLMDSTSIEMLDIINLEADYFAKRKKEIHE